MKIRNEIIIKEDIGIVFDVTNDIKLWPKIFTEYQSAEILSQSEGYVKFRLTMIPNENQKIYSWISERKIDKKELEIRANRVDPIFPFKEMDIYWKYEKVDEETLMIWEQTFTMDESSGFSDEVFGSHMDRNTKIQMQAIKVAIEGGTYL
jgi:aromatase